MDLTTLILKQDGYIVVRADRCVFTDKTELLESSSITEIDNQFEPGTGGVRVDVSAITPTNRRMKGTMRVLHFKPETSYLMLTGKLERN
jgi:hypothetical protein